MTARNPLISIDDYVNNQFGWYDSDWLSKFRAAEAIVALYHPGRLADFLGEFNALQTRKDYQTASFTNFLDAEKLAEIKDVIESVSNKEIETHEILDFGRLVVHDLPYFNDMQESLCDQMSEVAGEELEPCYNFLSLYNNIGDCKVHLDAPEAKWTLDMRIEQTAEWPIYFSQPRDWPKWGEYDSENWSDQILNDAKNQFTEFTLQPGDAILFSGSSQWHYRNKIVRKEKENFCHLVFFHYVPKNCEHLVDPTRWHEHFGMPELEFKSENA